MGLFGGGNSFFNKPFGSGGGSVSDTYTKVKDSLQGSLDRSGGDKIGSSVKKTLANQTGFNKSELQAFLRKTSSLAGASRRVDTEAAGFMPTFENKVVNRADLDKANKLGEGEDMSVSIQDRKLIAGSNGLTNEFTSDQVKGFVEAFKLRQEEVFSRRAKPGISQTRLV